MFHPIVSEDNKEFEIKITWQDGWEEQIYKIVIKSGTSFMGAY